MHGPSQKSQKSKEALKYNGLWPVSVVLKSPSESLFMVLITHRMEILETLLTDGPMSISEINAIMAEEGISEKTAQRARVRVGADQYYDKRVPMWKMPE